MGVVCGIKIKRDDAACCSKHRKTMMHAPAVSTRTVQALCSYIFLKGQKVGKLCEKKIFLEGEICCSVHNKQKEPKVVKEPKVKVVKELVLCSYVFSKGQKIGLVCDKKIFFEGATCCSKHKKKISKFESEMDDEFLMENYMKRRDVIKKYNIEEVLVGMETGDENEFLSLVVSNHQVYSNVELEKTKMIEVLEAFKKLDNDKWVDFIVDYGILSYEL